MKDQRGFTLVELLVASMCTVIVLGGAVALTAQIQNGYRRQLEDSVGEQEARYALEWIGRYLRSAGNNPMGATTSACMTGTFQGIIPDTSTGALRLQADINPPDKLIGGWSGNCTQANEDVTISLNSTLHEIQFVDSGTGGTVSTTRTDAVIDNLQFNYLESDRTTWDSGIATDIFYVQTVITIRTRTANATSGTPTTRTVSSEIRVRNR